MVCKIWLKLIDSRAFFLKNMKNFTRSPSSYVCYRSSTIKNIVLFLFVCCFTSYSRIFRHGDVNIAAKFRSRFGTNDPWAVRDLYRVIPIVIRALPMGIYNTRSWIVKICKDAIYPIGSRKTVWLNWLLSFNIVLFQVWPNVGSMLLANEKKTKWKITDI